MGQKSQDGARNYAFCHFLKFGSLDLLEIAYNDSLKQFLTFSRGKTYEKKNWESKCEPKSGPNLGFSPFSQVGSLVFLEIA